MSPILYVLIFLSVLLAVEGLQEVVSHRRGRQVSAARKRLRQMAALLQAPETLDEESILRAKREGASLVDRIVQALPFGAKLELSLYQAGLSVRPERFVLLSAGLFAGGGFVGMVLFEDLAMAAICSMVGLVPWVQLSRLRSKRRDRFEAQFPDALDLLIRALRAGHSLSTGLQMVGKELPDPVGSEFGQVAHEIQLGQQVRHALANLTYRVESEDLPFFVTAISIQQETGSNLAEVLQNLSRVIRERFKLYGKVKALTAMGRASANLLAGWPLVMIGALYSVNPEYIAPLWEEEGGQFLALISFVLVVIGYVICRRMAMIKV
jgi:tight adherence protein B